MTTRETFRERLHSIDWAGYCTAYGTAVQVPEQLLRLAGGGREAMAASHDLWCGLCHQHAFVSSAALPALPFILEVRDRADEALTAEILDLLLGFASCTRPEPTGDGPTWIAELRRCVAQQLPHLRELVDHPNVEISDLAGRIIGELTDEVVPGAKRP